MNLTCNKDCIKTCQITNTLVNNTQDWSTVLLISQCSGCAIKSRNTIKEKKACWPIVPVYMYMISYKSEI